MYKRNTELLLSKIEYIKQDNTESIIVKEKLNIHIPKFYEHRNVATFGDKVTTLGVFAIIDSDNNFTTSLAPSLLTMEPSAISSIEINDIEYYDLIFEEGDTLVTDTRIAKEAAFIYRTFAMYISAGNIPWFLDDVLLSTLFVNMSYFTEKKFSPYSSIIELIISAMTRNPENIDETYRKYINELGPGETPQKPEYIALRNFAITANSILNKYMGSYFEEGLTVALTTTSYQPTVIEQVLRQ